MSEVKQTKGSQDLIQKLINEKPFLLEQELKTYKVFKNDKFEWRSPLREKGYAEYRDQEFLDKLDVDDTNFFLPDFWPKRGPLWDGLGITVNSNKKIIIEAKAHIGEVITPSSKASQKSLEKIKDSLAKTRSYLEIKNDIEWSGKFYQYTNRIAHLYYLREKLNQDAYLLNIYFTGDKDVNGPETVEEWKGALELLKSYLGLKRHKLSKYMFDVFIDRHELK